MNIFFLDKNPCIAAQMLCDKHVVKMIVESCQLLAGVYYDTYSELELAKITKDFPREKGFYKNTHKNHPCRLWLQESKMNQFWLIVHLKWLCIEYAKRFKKNHACTDIADWFNKTFRSHFATRNNLLTPPALCTQGITHGNTIDDAVSSYREYYCKHKLHFAKWKLGNTPDFVKQYLEQQNENE